MSADDEAFIPYLVLVRFDKDGGDLKRRLAESVPALKEALARIIREERNVAADQPG